MCCLLQLEREPGHAEALRQRDLIPATQVQVDHSRDAVQDEDWAQVVELLSPAIEVTSPFKRPKAVFTGSDGFAINDICCAND